MSNLPEFPIFGTCVSLGVLGVYYTHHSEKFPWWILFFSAIPMYMYWKRESEKDPTAQMTEEEKLDYYEKNYETQLKEINERNENMEKMRVELIKREKLIKEGKETISHVRKQRQELANLKAEKTKHESN